MKLRERHHPSRGRAGILLCILALLVTPALAGAASVAPSDFDGPGGASKALGRSPVVAGPTDIENVDTGLFYATIQAALDDPLTLSGHVLNVQVASHAEGIVNVHKSVTIQGGGGGGAIITPTTNTGSSGDARGWFLVTASNVTFQDLTFDGTGYLIWQAIRITAAGTLVERCDFAHIGGSAASYDGRGVASTQNVTVRECTFTDMRRIGVHLFGSTVTSALVTDCTYNGKGAGDWLDYGVEFGGGAVGTLQNTTITGCTGVALVDGSTSAGVLITDYWAPGTAATLDNNFVSGCTTGIAVGYLATDVSVAVVHDNDLSGNGTGAQNTNVANVADFSANWWGSNDAATVAGSAGTGVDYTPWLHTGVDTNVAVGFQGDFSTLDVDDDSPQVGATSRVQEGINLVTASTVYVWPGTYTGNLILDKNVTLLGPQAGVDACGRVASEAILTATGRILELKAGCAGSVIDGFTLSAGTRGIESTSGPISNLQILNNRFVACTSSSVFLNDTGIDITVHQNSIDGSSSVGGGLFHLDQDNFDGLHFTDNCIVNGASGTGLFVDGNHNVGLSLARSPLIDGNLFDGNETGANLGRFAFEYGTISNNTFSNNGYDGLQGGIQHTAITGNTFSGNGRSGLALTGFGGTTDATRGAQYSTITNNVFTGNVREGLFFTTSQFAGTVSTNVAHQNDFVGNGTGGSGDGVAYGGTETLQLSCNWWGHLDGPDSPPSNPNPLGDDLAAANAVFAPWLDAPQPGGTCNQYGPNNVAAIADTCISSVHPCETVDVLFTRADPTQMRGYSVTFHLSPELMLCGTPTASILKGPYLPSTGNGTVFQVVDNGGGSYTVDEAILGTPCGVTGSGILFHVRVKNSGVDGSGTITVDAVTARDCFNVPIAGIPGASGTVEIDNTLPAAIADLAAVQLLTGNDTDGTTKIQISYTPPPDAAAVEVYRAPFGQYPEYDDNGGAVPPTPGYPPTAPWVLTGVTASGQYDEVTNRDYWYFVAFVADSCGNVGGVSNKTTGTLNYHLGDVSTGLTNCAGDNDVFTEDISLLGAHYAITLAPNDPWNCLDVGPTTTNYVDGRPLTDNRVQFEDLILFAINFDEVSKSTVASTPAASDEITVLVPEGSGDEILARLWVRGTGLVQGLSVQLAWNPAAVEPVGGIEAGELLRDLDGVAFESAPGGVDAALLGTREIGLAGEGLLATVRFRVVGAGDPAISVATVDARDAHNERVEMQRVTPADLAQVTPRVTQLLPNVPNPFNPSTRIAFTLAERGPVELAIYTVSGQRVRTLLRETRGAGLHELDWDGTDDAGRRLASGVYRMRLVTPDGARSRPMVMLK